MTRARSREHWSGVLWGTWVVAALLMLPVAGGLTFTAVIATSALALAIMLDLFPVRPGHGDRKDLVAMGVLYLVVVALMRLAFVGFTTDHVAGLFLSFAVALLLGVAGPVFYMVWMRGRTLASLGLRLDNWQPTLMLALLFGGVQFGITLWGYKLPALGDWVPLLVMALTVGVFEAVFFRGFIQNRLEAQFGPVVGVTGAAVLYGIYHVGYGMGTDELLFLTGLGVIYAIAFALVRNLLVLWPLLTPLGSFYANVEAGDIELPWASIAGFADVLGLMVLSLWLAHRHTMRRYAHTKPSPTTITTDT